MDMISSKCLTEGQNWDFSVWDYDHAELVALCKTFFVKYNLLQQFKVPNDRLDNFLRRIPLHYNNVPYHSYYHAVDVMQGAYCFLQMGAAPLLTPMEIMALLLATL
jgi:hypothetical protein